MKPVQADRCVVTVAGISSVWLDCEATTAKVIERIDEAARSNARLGDFGEAVRPGHPFRIEHGNRAKCESELQKTFHSYYDALSFDIAAGVLVRICARVCKGRIFVMIGCIERDSQPRFQ